mmetsp:Transcript_37387/g.99576  ORF Transcript_37387/g.99576 Transcript_37387/m.99576 type:complete len:386 (+) Transcript_37387:1857-3014(+)
MAQPRGTTGRGGAVDGRAAAGAGRRRGPARLGGAAGGDYGAAVAPRGRVAEDDRGTWRRHLGSAGGGAGTRERCSRRGSGGGVRPGPPSGSDAILYSVLVLADVEVLPHVGRGLERPGPARANVGRHPQGHHVLSRGLRRYAWQHHSVHRMFGLPAPLAGRGEFSAWARGLRSVAGRPRRLTQPIDRKIVVDLLELQPAALVDVRDKLVTVVGTLACLRTAEIADLQVCDVLFDLHARAFGEAYAGTAALRVIKRKNDSERRGHFPVLGRAEDPRRDVVQQLRAYMERMNLTVQPGCKKTLRPGARCQRCTALFPMLAAGGKRATGQACTRQMVSEAIKRAAGAGTPRPGAILRDQRSKGRHLDRGGRRCRAPLPAERPRHGTGW